MTDGVKLSKETLFFLDSTSGDEDVKTKKPPARPKANGSPAKAKTVGGKVLRNPRRAAQDEVHQTAATRLMEHQKELHQRLQDDGIARFSEGGGGIAGKEGKGWKKFQSYKGEGALPDEVDKLRVYFFLFHQMIWLLIATQDLCRSQSTDSDSADSRFRCPFPYQYH